MLKGYKINGIQQVGVGVKNHAEAWKWYRRHLGMNVRVFEEKAIAEIMLPYTGGKKRERHACLAMNMQGGGGFEIWQHTGREPLYPNNKILFGDLGIYCTKIKTNDIKKAYNFYNKQNIEIINEITENPAGEKHFFIKDIYGNLFDIVENSYVFRKESHPNGGVLGIIIGCIDIDKSIPLYQEILGYDKIIFDKTDTFNDFHQLEGNTKCRRVLLRHNETKTGAFSPLLGNTEIELISIDTNERKPQNLFKDRMWGDPGFIHICFDIQGMDALREKCINLGYPFTVDSAKHYENTFDMGSAAGDFSYIEDPNGVLIEFVETKKVPIIEKLNLYINLKKRKPNKSLPIWLLKAFRFSKIKD